MSISYGRRFNDELLVRLLLISGYESKQFRLHKEVDYRRLFSSQTAHF